MKTLLFIAHTPSENTRLLATQAIASIQEYAPALRLVTKQPQEVQIEDGLACDGIMLGTIENIGYMSGMTKDMFDRCYNDWLDSTAAKPVAIYIRAGLDGTATKNALTSICGGLKWRLIAAPLIVRGSWQDSFCDQVSELCLGVVLGIDSGIY